MKSESLGIITYEVKGFTFLEKLKIFFGLKVAVDLEIIRHTDGGQMSLEVKNI